MYIKSFNDIDSIGMIGENMKLNLDFYKSDILYDKFISQDVQKRIIENYINKISPENYFDVLETDNSIETVYSLSYNTKNIISWYPFEKDSKILEIGARLGELTGVLCDKAKKVVSVEFSKSRGEAISVRHRNKENLEVIIGDLKDIKFKDKFDYITMIGILEYAPIVMQTENPYEDLIKYAVNLLNKNGKILIAVDNRIGSKYLVGGKSEHYDEVFGSIEEKNDGTSKLFTKKELEELLDKFKFSNRRFYYPLPDYKFADVIFSDDYLPKNNSKLIYNFIYNENSIIVADEISLIKEFSNNNEFEEHANSFFVELNNNSKDNIIKFVNYNNLRKPVYSLNLRMYENIIEKQAQNKEATVHINSIKNNIKLLKDLGINIDEKVENNILYSKFIDKEQFSNILYDNIINHNFLEFYKNIDEWYKYLCDILSCKGDTSNINKNLIDFEIDESLKNKLNIIKYGFIDFVFENTFYKNKKYILIDQEWYVENIPVQFILYRAINNFYSHNANIVNILRIEEVLARYDLLKFKSIFDKMEVNFQNMVIDKTMLKFYSNQYKYIKNLTEIESIENQICSFDSENNRKVEFKEIKKIYSEKVEHERYITKLENDIENVKKYNVCLENEIASYKDSRIISFILKINKFFKRNKTK